MDVLLLVSLGCAAPVPVSPGVPAAPAAAAPAPVSPPVAATPAPPPELALGGILPDACEPSALVRLGDHWIVGDNETEDRLFTYDEDMEPDTSPALGAAVEDIEALVIEGMGSAERMIVVGSHSRNKNGKLKPDRHKIEVVGYGIAPAPFALDLTGCPACLAAEPLAPNEGGFNLEGAAMLNGAFLLGARSPLVAGSAMLFVVSRAPGTAGHIERTIQLDLGGAGIRELTPFRGGLLIVAGPPADAGTPHSLWLLANLDATPTRLDVTLPPSTEGLWPRDDTHLRYVVDGDGKAGACVTPGRWGEVVIPAGVE